MGGKELLHIAAAVVVPDENGYQDAAEDEYHVHVGVIPDIPDDIERNISGNDAPDIGIMCQQLMPWLCVEPACAFL